MTTDVFRLVLVSQLLTLTYAMVPVARLAHDHVITWRRGRRFRVLIDEACGLDPAVLVPFEQLIHRTLSALSGILIPGVTPTVACHLEELDGQIVDADTSPYLISLYVQHGTMPQDVADGLAGSTAYILRHL
ncbi:hypothetical protein DQ384_36345 [Sphaerisporangium album]|uniref:Uncharacterized protein n=1 Tax=Sphaerisporangium album TaxID=509200 RepID=A0A367EV52_9ACTN|nr:hypothetical protein [Sphaerisporangium album]RCG21933.1 hypothetical protein DQ384_36345 [Sphaerisporangium album]